MSNFKEEADKYTIAAITDFCDGVGVDELKEILKLYEEDENYEACYGIKVAIDCVELAKEGYYD